MAENEEPAEQPSNLLWAIDEIIIALQRFRQRLKRLAAEGKKSDYPEVIPSPAGSARARFDPKAAKSMKAGLARLLPSVVRSPCGA
jgi:hypothetical protein